MNKRIIWLVASTLMVISLLIAACTPAPAKETAPAAPAAPVVKEAAPVVKEATPVVKEAVPVMKEAVPGEGKDMVKVSLTKLDGTKMEKLVEKPKYGGTLYHSRRAPILAWDEAYWAPWSITYSLTQTNQDLLMGSWYRGPAGTAEYTWMFSEILYLDSIAGELAESWELAGPDTLIFHIRKGVRWALNPASEASRLVNGREFTADDAVFNIKRIYMDLPTSTMYGMLGVGRPTEVYAKDKYTVVLKAPAGTIGDTLLNVADLTKMVPPEVVKKYGDMNKWENVVGTGPFMLVDYVPMSSATWVRNPNYWEYDPVLGPDYPLPYVDGIKMLIIPDASTEMAALRTGRVDSTITNYGYFKEDWQQLMKSNPDLQWYKNTNHGYACFAGRVDKDLPFNDIRVRKALNMAIDRQEILDTYYKGDGTLLPFYIPPHPDLKKWYTPIEELPQDLKEIYCIYNPQKAKQLLTEAGYPNGFKTELCLSSGSQDQIDMAQMFQYYWAKIGVDLTLNVKEPAVYDSMYQRKTYLAMMASGGGANQRSMYCLRTGNMWNRSMSSDPKFDQYYQDISAAFFDEPKRDRLMKEMNEYALRVAYWYPYPNANYYRMVAPWVRNYYGTSGTSAYSYLCEYRYVWLDHALKKSMGQ